MVRFTSESARPIVFSPRSMPISRAFARNLAPLTDLAICFWDERLSTAAVERTLIEAETSRKRRDVLIDKVAATYILQGALDRLGYGAAG